MRQIDLERLIDLVALHGPGVLPPALRAEAFGDPAGALARAAGALQPEWSTRHAG